MREDWTEPLACVYPVIYFSIALSYWVKNDTIFSKKLLSQQNFICQIFEVRNRVYSLDF